jgi:hypothetical protein
MVSSSLEMTEEALLAVLDRLRASGDPEYVALRADLPEDWPI